MSPPGTTGDVEIPEHLEVLIVGAGISGIGAACHLEERCPGKSYAVLEAREAIGGTWDLFRYPGIRSDSDMYTLGYRFRPWTNPKSIADGPSILRYVHETARDHGVEERIRFGHRVVRAAWSSADARWSIDVELDGDPGRTAQLTCSFLLSCSGYYDYAEGYTPAFPEIERFEGEVIHPQHWDENLDYAGKRVAVIGSGATAVTIVPAMAESAAHVTMLQRSPSYVVSLPSEDPFATRVRRHLSPKRAYAVVRWKNVLMTMLVFQLSRRRPELVKRLVRRGVVRALPAGFEVDTHFKPTYNPWDQRMCLVPDGDFFRAIREGRASVVTDRIETFTKTGIRLASGEELKADLIVTATGLNLIPLGGVELSVDDREVDLPSSMTYKSLMLSGVPNLVLSVGYTNASWTLKCDLTSEYACRLIKHMDERGYASCVPENTDPSVSPEPFIDFSSGYVLRAIDRFPQQGSKPPWRLRMNYARDIVTLRLGAIEDGVLVFSRRGPAGEAEPRPLSQRVAA